eukprot:scaffold3365_cov358-Prasinococcus_capsulatus_cf.AAC.3
MMLALSCTKRTSGANLVAHELVTMTKQVRYESLHGSLKVIAVRGRNGVPELWGSKMQIVDAI